MPSAMLTEVQILDRGTSATANASSGASTVTVEDLTQFDEDGGWLDICGRQYEYASINETTSQITLVGTLTANVDEFDPVLVVAGGEIARDYLAIIDLGEGDNVTVPVAYNMRAQLPEGLYDPPVDIVVSADLREITDLPGRAPVLQGGYLEPGSVPTDGEPPSESPTPVVLGAIGALAVKWEPVENKDVVTYEVHISTSNGFTPDETTLSSEETGAQHYIRKMPNGSALAYGTLYYVKLVAKDKDGAADPGDQGSGQMVKADTPDIAVNAITADQIVANAITTEKISADAVTADELSADAIDGRVITGSTLRTAASGERMELQVVGADNPAGQLAFWTAGSNESPLGPAGIFADEIVPGGYALSLKSAISKTSGGVPLAPRAQLDLVTLFNPGPQNAVSRITFDANSVLVQEPSVGAGEFTVNVPAHFVGDVSIDGALTRGDDTGWINLTLDSGNQAVSGATPGYRMVGDQVFLRGKVEKTSGSWGTGSTVTFVSSTPLPTAARPSMRRDFQAAGHAAAASVKLLINTSGSIQIVTGTTVPSYVDLSCGVWMV